jgi:hypothetical protein
MSYDYSSESQRLELPNPYRLQNQLLWLCTTVLLVSGIVSLWWAREALQGESFRRAGARLVAGLVLVAAGILCGATAARRLRFFFGRGRPASLAPEIPPQATGTSKSADALKDMLRQGGLSYPEPKGALEGLLYHWAPRLITAPLEVQWLAQRYAFNLAAIAATLLSFVFSWAVFGTPATRPWIGLLYFAFGAFFLAKPVLTQDRARLSAASLVGLIAAAILGPVLVALVAPSLPKPGDFFTVNLQVFVMLGTSLVACALAMAAVLAQVDDAPQTRASVEQQRLSMNAPPAMLMDELDRTLQQQWTDRIPNRRYARLDPQTPASTPAGAFAGELLEETQPMPRAGNEGAGFAAALATRRHRPLLLIDLYALLLVLVGVVLAMVFVQGFDAGRPWPQQRFGLAGTAAILIGVAAFCFTTSSQLWGRFNFESLITWVELIGNYQTSRIGTGNQFSSRMNTQNDVVRVEAMTLRIWRARLESVVFGKDQARRVTAMFSTEQEAKLLAAHLMQFAQGQSVLVAPGSAADQARIASLQAGEQALGGHDTPAAQLAREQHLAAALASTQVPAVHCTQCGTAAPAGARFCAKCGTALAAP